MLDGFRETVRPYYLKWLYFPLFPGRRPNYFNDCWRFGQAAPGAGLSQSRDLSFLFLPMTDWHTRLQRTQQLALALARQGHSCWHLNPHVGREFPNPAWTSAGPLVTQLADGVREVHVHLASEPVFHHRLLSEKESRFLAGALESVDGVPGRTVQVVSIPAWLEAARELRRRRGWPVVYDCHDQLSGFRSVGRDIVAAEGRLFDTADLVLFSSRYLMSSWISRKPEIAGKSVLLRNAVDNDWTDGQPAARPGGPLTVGYVGALDFWFDTGMISAAAAAHPDWRFVLIGRVEDRRVLKLRHLPNVVFTGEIPHGSLREKFAAFDVGIIPFVLDELTRAADPIKLYEYFSFGLPVVSSRLPDLETFADLIYFAGSAGEFARRLEHAAAENDPERRAARRRVATDECWAARACFLRDTACRLLDRATC